MAEHQQRLNITTSCYKLSMEVVFKMANWNHIPKSGMQGHNCSRWAYREEVKESTRKGRRNLDKFIIEEQVNDEQDIKKECS